MCGIGLLLESPLILDQQGLLPSDESDQSSVHVPTEINTSIITAAYEKCLMESIAPRGPDLPYSKKHFSIVSKSCHGSVKKEISNNDHSNTNNPPIRNNESEMTSSRKCILVWHSMTDDSMLFR